MSLNTAEGYPKRYSLFDLNSSDFIENKAIWKQERGFSPSPSLFYNDNESVFLVIPLYRDDKIISYQLRDLNTDDVDQKYKLTRPVYDTCVKTDQDELPGRKVIVEGTIDSMLLRQHKINAHTLLGLKKFKVVRFLEEIENEKFLYVLDNDNFGNLFSNKHFKYKGVEYKVPFGYKDINQLFLQDKTLFLKYIDGLKRLTQV